MWFSATAKKQKQKTRDILKKKGKKTGMCDSYILLKKQATKTVWEIDKMSAISKPSKYFL